MNQANEFDPREMQEQSVGRHRPIGPFADIQESDDHPKELSAGESD